MGKLVNISENWKISVISVNSAISQKSSDHVYVYRNPRIYHVVEFDDFKMILNTSGCRKNFMLKISTASFETIRDIRNNFLASSSTESLNGAISWLL